jgi:hypothetical protein
MEAVCKTGKECSRVKSSAKVGVPTNGLSGLIWEELTPAVCLNGLNRCRLWLRFTDDRFFAMHFFGKIIATPFVDGKNKGNSNRRSFDYGRCGDLRSG